jgi:hypothetical protein
MAVATRSKAPKQASRLWELWELIYRRPPTEREMRAWENALGAADAYFDEVGSDAPCPCCMVRVEHRLVAAT